jgi:hypothetical protein
MSAAAERGKEMADLLVESSAWRRTQLLASGFRYRVRVLTHLLCIEICMTADPGRHASSHAVLNARQTALRSGSEGMAIPRSAVPTCLNACLIVRHGKS